jgi:diguanylate cyclase (GGDEF)-like protein
LSLPDKGLHPDSFSMVAAGGFEFASRAILAYLHRQFGFKLWMTTRTEGDDWIILQAENHGYDVHEGSVFRWADTFCARMLKEEGPRVAPDVQDVPAYAAAPLGAQLPTGAYIGVPMTRLDGSFLGTLSAIDPEPQSIDVDQALPLVELLARLLGIVLENELRAVAQQRLLERTLEAAQTDVLTGLLNRRGWEAGIALEAARVRRYGVAVCVLVVDISAGTSDSTIDDALVSRAAECMRACVRDSDILARIEGNEFGVLALECGATGAEKLGIKLKNALTEVGISAAVGGVAFDPIDEIEETVARAAEAMVADKARQSIPDAND